MFVLMSSRTSSKLAHLESKTRSQGQISRKLCLHSSGHIFEAIIMNLAQSVCRFLGQVRNWVTWCQKLGHLARSAENLVNTLVVTFFNQSSWILLNMFVLMISRSSLKLGHLGSKTGHLARSAENLVNTLVVTFFNQSSWILLNMFVLMISRSSLKLGHWGQKLGHLAKSAENLVNTLAVIFLKQSSWILLKMFVLMISRSSLKQGYMGSKPRWPGQISRKLLTLQRSHFWNNHHKLLKIFVLMISRSSLKLGHLI